MRGVYTAHIKITALVAAKTLIYITAPSTKVVEILSISVTNSSSESNEQLECCWQKITTLGTPTATTLTPSKHESGDQASASTSKGNVTASEPSYTTDTEICKEGFSSVGGYFFDPVPEERPIISASDSWGLRMLSTPTSFDANCKITYREIG